jgi:hypothetical protein
VCLIFYWRSTHRTEAPPDGGTLENEAAVQVLPEAGIKGEKAPGVRQPPKQRALGVTDPFAEKSGETYAVGRLADDFPRLAAQADNGDMVAARTLSRSLLACNSAPSSADAVRLLAESARDGLHDYSWWPGGAEDYVEHQKQLYQRCGALSASRLGSRSRWIEMLAVAGDSEARVQYAVTNIPNDPYRIDSQADRREFVRRAEGYLQSEIDAGNARALLAMAQAYSRPPIVGAESSFGIDPSRAYMYRYAYALTEEGALYASSGETILARLEKDMDPQEVSILRNQAESIYQQCCH